MNGVSALDKQNGSSLPRLPPEIIHQIIQHVVLHDSPLIVPTYDILTKTLLALTRTSRLTYKSATDLLWKRCLYIDSDRRLSAVLLCMNSLTPTLPAPGPLRNITSLHLEPFGYTLNLTGAQSVKKLLTDVSPTLERLVVSMPFGSLDRLQDHQGVRETLRQGFECLIKLQEFICLDEYPLLSISEENSTDVWRLWPELRRLCLFDVPVGNHWLWWNIATLSKLQQVVLVRPKGLERTNIKDEYFHKLPRDDVRLDRQIDILLVGAFYEMPKLLDTSRWEEIDDEERMVIERIDVPVMETVLEEEGPIVINGVVYHSESIVEADELVEKLVRQQAFWGTLWEWAGMKVTTHDIDYPCWSLR